MGSKCGLDANEQFVAVLNSRVYNSEIHPCSTDTPNPNANFALGGTHSVLFKWQIQISRTDALRIFLSHFIPKRNNHFQT